MKILVVTQVLDSEDPVLGFFHQWVEGFATTFDSVQVICLKEGTHSLPANISVHSLGKEQGGQSRFAYTLRFISLAWKLRKEYDSVFVHQNQEYLLIAGVLWWWLKKPAYMWRNHYAGSILTDIAACFCKRVFCTSRFSYTAKYRKTVFMPVGVETEKFTREEIVVRAPRSILFIGRIASSKRPELFIDALGIVLERSISFTAAIVGSPRKEDEPYAESLGARAEALGLRDRLVFHPAVPHEKVPAIFAGHDIYVNSSPSGMFDKTLFEAAAAGCRVLSTSKDFATVAGDDTYFEDSDSLAEKLIIALSTDEDTQLRERIKLGALARQESLATLMDRLKVELVA